MNVLNRYSSFADAIKFLSSLLNIQGNVEPSRFSIPLDVVANLVHFLVEGLSIVLVVSDKSGQALVPLEVGYFIIEVLYLMGDEILDILALLAVVDPILGILVANILNQLGLVLLEPLLNEQKQLLLALPQLLADVLRQPVDVVVQLHLRSINSTFLRSNYSSLTIEL